MKSFPLHRLPSEEILRILLWCDDGRTMQAVPNLLADKLPYSLFRINTLLLIDLTTIKGTTSYSWTRVQKRSPRIRWLPSIFYRIHYST